MLGVLRIVRSFERDPAAFQLALPGYAGQFEDLLRLSSLRKISLEGIALAEATAQLAAYLQYETELDLDQTGYLLVTAARLLAMKSDILLARPADPEDISVVRQSPSSAIPRPMLSALVTQLVEWEGRECFAPVAAPHLVERNVLPRRPESLRRAWELMQERWQEPAKRVAVHSFVRMEATMSSLIRKLHSGAKISLHLLLRGATREDAVVHFVAVLELVRRQQAQAVQSDPFGDITVEFRERAEGASARAG
jgi:segregation and condensation protein A